MKAFQMTTNKMTKVGNYLTLLVCLVAGYTGYSQVTIVTTPTNYKTIQASNAEYDSKSINTSLSVGAVEGKFEVSLTGGSSYRIKPDLPPGIKGMMPNLEIMYNSQAGNTILGNGWNLTGISTISRTPQYKYYYNNIKGISCTGSNSQLSFIADGQTLITKINLRLIIKT